VKSGEKMEEYSLEIIKPPGLKPIKQVELDTKFCPYVPRKYWDETCLNPSDGVMEIVRK
jgi:hypothetical protein